MNPQKPPSYMTARRTRLPWRKWSGSGFRRYGVFIKLMGFMLDCNILEYSFVLGGRGVDASQEKLSWLNSAEPAMAVGRGSTQTLNHRYFTREPDRANTVTARAVISAGVRPTAKCVALRSIIGMIGDVYLNTVRFAGRGSSNHVEAAMPKSSTKNSGITSLITANAVARGNQKNVKAVVTKSSTSHTGTMFLTTVNDVGHGNPNPAKVARLRSNTRDTGLMSLNIAKRVKSGSQNAAVVAQLKSSTKGIGHTFLNTVKHANKNEGLRKSRGFEPSFKD
jgi:hypothetical protein